MVSWIKGDKLGLKLVRVANVDYPHASHKVIRTGLWLARPSASISAILTNFSSVKRALSFFSAAWKSG
jgi:hypothetical protein